MQLWRALNGGRSCSVASWLVGSPSSVAKEDFSFPVVGKLLTSRARHTGGNQNSVLIGQPSNKSRLIFQSLENCFRLASQIPYKNGEGYCSPMKVQSNSSERPNDNFGRLILGH